MQAFAENHPHAWLAKKWCDYFQCQKERLLLIPWEQGPELAAAEKTLIGAFLAEFQQGEGQEGGHFYRCVRTYAEATGAWDYLEAHRLFMEEEKRHARDLGRFLDLAAIPRLTRQSWLSRGFCWFGSRGGLESTLVVILMAEVIALVYYRVVRNLTGSSVLRRLCDQILRDEKSHVRFQTEQLAHLRLGRSRWRLALAHAFDAAMFTGAVLACWMGHRHVFRAGGYGFRGLWSLARTKWRSAGHVKSAANLSFNHGLLPVG